MAVIIVAEWGGASPAPPLTAAAAGGWALVVLLLVLGAVAVAYEVRRRLRQADAADDADDVPLLVFPLGSPDTRPPVPRARRAPEPAEAARPGGRPAGGSAPAAPRAVPARQSGPGADGAPGAAPPAPERATATGTLQLLPGRLEVVSGLEQRAEIRFVKAPGRDTTITLGRNPGEAPAHVQLPIPTVSGLHARMQYQHGSWFITNLSRTNPVVVNGAELNGSGASLHDGDQIELGEVVLRFRAR
jgi:hypothetical protein